MLMPEARKAQTDALSGVGESWAVPPGLELFFPHFPALKRWAKLARPSGAGLSSARFDRITRNEFLLELFERPSGYVPA
jgi:hypothetical protein